MYERVPEKILGVISKEISWLFPKKQKHVKSRKKNPEINIDRRNNS